MNSNPAHVMQMSQPHCWPKLQPRSTYPEVSRNYMEHSCALQFSCSPLYLRPHHRPGKRSLWWHIFLCQPSLRIPGYCITTKLQLMPNSNVFCLQMCCNQWPCSPQISYLCSHTKCLKEEQPKYRRLNSPRAIKSDTGGNSM